MAQATTETRTRKHAAKQTTDAEPSHADDDRAVPSAEGISGLVDQAESAIQPTVERLADFVRERPFQSLGLALGAGYLGRILFRGPVITLAILGGVGYLGARLAAK